MELQRRRKELVSRSKQGSSFVTLSGLDFPFDGISA